MPHNCSRCGATCTGIPLAQPASDSEIEALLRTNSPPSEAQEAFFRETRRTGQLRLADVQAKLDLLLQERDRLVWNMQRCTDVLNPVRRLPSDVLCEIFAQSMTDAENSYSIHSRADLGLRDISTPHQWRLGMICMNWRHVVLNYPWIWSVISLSYRSSSDRVLKSRKDSHLYFGTSQLLAMHIYRSANHPLRVTLRGPIPQSLLFILISASYRWEHLCLDRVNLETVDSPLKALVQFQYISTGFDGFDEISEPVPLLRSATSLRRLVFNDIKPILHSDRVIIPWTQINSLVVNTFLSNEDAIALFKPAPKLESVALHVWHHSLLDPSHPVPDSVHSRSLKSFSLNISPRSASAKHFSTVKDLFDSLTLPALKHFRIVFGGASGLSESITRLLRRSECALKRLALIGASAGALEGILGADECGNIEELVIGELGDVSCLQIVLEILTESAALLRLRTVEIDASDIVDSIDTCQDAAIQFLESRQVENGGFGRLDSLTLHAWAPFEFSEASVQRLEALRRFGTRFYIYRH